MQKKEIPFKCRRKKSGSGLWFICTTQPVIMCQNNFQCTSNVHFLQRKGELFCVKKCQTVFVNMVKKRIQKFAKQLVVGRTRGCVDGGPSTETVQTHGIQITLYFVKRPAQSLHMLEVRFRYIIGLSSLACFYLDLIL